MNLHLSHTCWRNTAAQLENSWCTGWLHKTGYDVTQLWLTHFAFSLLRCFWTSGFSTLRWSSSFLKLCYHFMDWFAKWHSSLHAVKFLIYCMISHTMKVDVHVAIKFVYIHIIHNVDTIQIREITHCMSSSAACWPQALHELPTLWVAHHPDQPCMGLWCQSLQGSHDIHYIVSLHVVNETH